MCNGKACSKIGALYGDRVIVDDFERTLLAGLLAEHIQRMEKPVTINADHSPQFIARYMESRTATYAKLIMLYREQLHGRMQFADKPGPVRTHAEAAKIDYTPENLAYGGL